VEHSENAQLKLRRDPSQEELEQICEAAENAARDFLFTQFNPKLMLDLEISVESTGDAPLILDIEISVSPAKGVDDLSDLVDKACDKAFEAAEEKARELNVA